MAEKYEWIDMGLTKFLKNIVFLQEINARVGVVGSGADEAAGSGGMSVGEVALISEFGNGHVPERSFIRSAIKTHKSRELSMTLARAALGFGNMIQAFHTAGEGLAQIMRDTVLNGTTLRNAPETIRRKGFNHPLLETKKLHDAIGHELVRGSDALGD